MPRPLKGTITERRLADGKTIAYDVRVRDVQRTLGYSPRWTPTRAQHELDERIVPMAKLHQPWWEAYDRAAAQPSDDEFDAARLLFHTAASDYLQQVDDRYANLRTRSAYGSPVTKHLLPFFAYRDAGVDFGSPCEKQYLVAVQPSRDWLRPDQFEAILDAGYEVEARARKSYARLGRPEMIATLALAGLRVTELCHVRAGHVDRTSRTLRVPESKTNAGVRDIFLDDQLLNMLVARIESCSLADGDLLFATASGAMRDRNSVRSRVLLPVLAQAAVLLKQRRQRELPAKLICHTFRRTFLTYLAWNGETARYAMGQAGHRDAKLTLEHLPAAPRPRLRSPGQRVAGAVRACRDFAGLGTATARGLTRRDVRRQHGSQPLASRP
jgi:integrase